MTISKAALTELLAGLRAEFTGEVLLYAPSRKPDRNPHRAKPTPHDEHYAEVLADGQRLIEARTKLT